MGDNRRSFLHKMLALASVPGAAAAQTVSAPSFGATGSGLRQFQAFGVRESAAVFQSLQPVATHPTNGDEAALAGRIGNFVKGLPHTSLGQVQSAAYDSLLLALSTASPDDFAKINMMPGAKLVNPMAAYAFQMEGADSHRLGMDAPPAFRTAAAAGEMVELYWQALARDVNFTDYATSPTIQAAVADMNRLSAFAGPKVSGQVTAESLFRGNITGGLQGPYVSQFLWLPIPVNSTNVAQLYNTGKAGLDYLTSWAEWLAIQNGGAPARLWTPDPQARYVHNGRSLAEWVHYDCAYQAYHNAALMLLNQAPDTFLKPAPLNPTNPYMQSKTMGGFVTFGAAQICSIMGLACQTALLAAWYQKWLLHRRLRPEEFGGHLHEVKTGAAAYPIHTDLMNSAALKAVFAANGTYLLPQAYPEGCPLHPSYPSGHATVSGACAAVLKAFFDETHVLTNCVVANADGTALNPYNDQPLTLGGEINKLAFNVAMGRNFAGIHYRSDAEGGIRLGEDVAIAMLQDLVHTYGEDFTGFRFSRVDGTPVVINS